MTPGILDAEVVVDSVEIGVVVIDGDSESPDNHQEGGPDQVEGSHKVSSDIEEPDLSNPVVGDEGEAPHEHNNEPG